MDIAAENVKTGPPSASGSGVSLHASKRMGQRGITPEDLDLVFQKGKEVHNGGALFLFMRRKDLPSSIPPARREKLEGLTIVVSVDSGEIITVYKNRGGLREILKKRKTRRESDRFHGFMAA